MSSKEEKRGEKWEKYFEGDREAKQILYHLQEKEERKEGSGREREGRKMDEKLQRGKAQTETGTGIPRDWEKHKFEKDKKWVTKI